jgi:predicted restriction endonuclease
VQYSLASRWDEHHARAEVEKVKEQRARAVEEQDPYAKVPKELRSKLKHARGAKGLLQDLEEQVREFVRSWDETQKQLEEDGLADADTSEDEEIVFVGRNGQTKESRSESLSSKAQKERMVFDSLVADQGAAFG